MTLNLILIVLASLYAVELSLYAAAAARARRQGLVNRWTGEQPKVSVIVAAKDEELNLPACIESLVRLDYPHSLLEVIIVNDQSIDGTAAVIDTFTKRYGFVRRVDAVEDSVMRGKANALSQGIESARGELIFLTDADCAVPASWIRGTLRHFGKRTGVVGGVTLISRTTDSVSGMQALDWDILLTVAAGAATLRKPLACLGNNLAFRKEAYDDVGGYRKIRFSVTEDYALFKAIVSSGRWDYAYPMDSETLVETLPVGTLGKVFRQRRRWAVGGKDTGVFGMLTLVPGFLFHWAIIASIFFSPTALAAAFAFKLVVDTLFALPTLRFYGKIAHLKFILYFEIYYLIYVAILPFSVYLGKGITWKGRKY